LGGRLPWPRRQPFRGASRSRDRRTRPSCSEGLAPHRTGSDPGGLLRFRSAPVEPPPATLLQPEYRGRPIGDNLVVTIANHVHGTEDLRPSHLCPPPHGHRLGCPPQSPRRNDGGCADSLVGAGPEFALPRTGDGDVSRPEQLGNIGSRSGHGLVCGVDQCLDGLTGAVIRDHLTNLWAGSPEVTPVWRSQGCPLR